MPIPAKFLPDLIVTIIIWTYFTLGYLIFFFPFNINGFMQCLSSMGWTSRGKSSTSGMPSIGWGLLGARFIAEGRPPVGLLATICLRSSWQPTQLVISPGITLTKLCIRLTE